MNSVLKFFHDAVENNVYTRVSIWADMVFYTPDHKQVNLYTGDKFDTFEVNDLTHIGKLSGKKTRHLIDLKRVQLVPTRL